MLYCLGGRAKSTNYNHSSHKINKIKIKYNDTYSLCFKKFDTRIGARKWIDCLDEFKKLKNIEFNHMFD